MPTPQLAQPGDLGTPTPTSLTTTAPLQLLLAVVAPSEEATFFSLPYVEELLGLYHHILFAGGGNTTNAASSHNSHGSPSPTGAAAFAALPLSAHGCLAGSLATAAVRCRLETERVCEAVYLDGDGVREGARAGHFSTAAAASALDLLRLGLSRALGFPTGEEEEAGGGASLPAPTAAAAAAAAAAPLPPHAERCGSGKRRQPAPRPPSGGNRINSSKGGGESKAAGSPAPAPAHPHPHPNPNHPHHQSVPMLPVDDRLLCRRRQVFTHHRNNTTTAFGYIEESGEDLRRSAFLEWFEDLLGFLVAADLSAVQARCVLIDAMVLLECLDGLPAGAPGAEVDDELVEMATVAFFEDALTAQSCPVPTRVVETIVSQRPVTRLVPDSDLIATLEHQLRTEKKLGKKQVAAIREQLAAVPVVPRTAVEEERVEVEREVMVGPYFTLSEAAAVLDYLTGTLLSHWRLVKTTMTARQPTRQATSVTAAIGDGGGVRAPPHATQAAATAAVAAARAMQLSGIVVSASSGGSDVSREEEKEGSTVLGTTTTTIPTPTPPTTFTPLVEAAVRYVLYEDVDPLCIPPLQRFLPTSLHAQQRARGALWRETAEGAEALFLSEYCAPLEALAAAECGERCAIAAAKAAADADNRASALVGGEYVRVERAYTLRLRRALAAAAGLDPDDDDADAVVAEREGLPRAGNGTSGNAPSSGRERSANRSGGGGGKALPGNGSTATAAPTTAAAAASGGTGLLPPVLAGQPRIPADAIVLPTGAVFDLPAVEARVDTAGASLDGLLSDPRLAKKMNLKR